MARQRSGISRFGTREEGETTNTRILAEVKSGKPTISQVRAFCRVMDKNNAIGVFITIEPVSTGMRQEAADMGTFLHNNETFPRLQFWQIDDAYFQNPGFPAEPYPFTEAVA